MHPWPLHIPQDDGFSWACCVKAGATASSLAAPNILPDTNPGCDVTRCYTSGLLSASKGTVDAQQAGTYTNKCDGGIFGVDVTVEASSGYLMMQVGAWLGSATFAVRPSTAYGCMVIPADACFGKKRSSSFGALLPRLLLAPLSQVVEVL